MVDASFAEFLVYAAVFGVIVLVVHWVSKP
jgi:hypothetical protein